MEEARDFPHLCYHGMFILCPLNEVLGSEVMALSVGKMGKPWLVLEEEGNNNTCRIVHNNGKLDMRRKTYVTEKHATGL